MFFNKRLIYRLLLALLFLFGVIFLLSGSAYLVKRVKILFGFHVGTVISWMILIFASLLAININKYNRKLFFFSSISFYLSIFWLLISFLLAGNNNLVFHASQVYFKSWIVISAFPVLVLIVSIVYNLLLLLKKNSSFRR